MAVVDAHYIFLFIEIGQPGGDSDGGIWSNRDIPYAIISKSPFLRTLSIIIVCSAGIIV